MKAEEAEITLNLKHFLASCGLPHHLNAPGVCLTDAAWRFGLDSHNPISTLFSPTLVSNREPTLMLTALRCSRRRSEIVIYLGLSGESMAFWSRVTSVSESCQFVLMILQDILWLNVNGLFYHSIILFSSHTKPAPWPLPSVQPKTVWSHVWLQKETVVSFSFRDMHLEMRNIFSHA